MLIKTLKSLLPSKITNPSGSEMRAMNPFWGGRAALLVRSGLDEFSHFSFYYRALAEAFAKRGIELSCHEIDSPNSDELSALGEDPNLLFFLNFNGWATNLTRRDIGTSSAAARSFFTYFGKPLLDHFADPPFANEMQHAQQFDIAERLVLYTDHTYLAWDGLYGPQRHSSYFLPQFVPLDKPSSPAIPFAERSFHFLLPVSLYNPDMYYESMLNAAPERSLGQALFDDLVGTFLNDPRSDAIQWVSHLWLRNGIPFDAHCVWQQRVMSAAWHYVKNRRRQMILETLADVPLAIITKTIPYSIKLHPDSKVLAPRSFAELSAVVANTRVCICPTPHTRGFHERVLLAMSRGAVALTSPNQICEENFCDGEEILYFQDHGSDLLRKVQSCRENWAATATIASRGQQTQQARFSADNTVDHMLRIFHNFHCRSQTP